MLHWLKKELVSSQSADWIDQCALWAIDRFGANAFWQHTCLVRPDSSDFPEKHTGPEPMARYILARVTALMGVAQWPWQLRDFRAIDRASPPLLGLDSRQRFNDSATAESPFPAIPSWEFTPLQVPLVMDQMAKPQDLVASIAHTCAQHMLWQSQLTPPGGMDYFEQAAEVLAHFSGFGLMLTNSAYTYRGGCGRCYNPRANRQASLSESESVYALALFCYLKQEPTSHVFNYLKPHLKGSYKLALKQIKNRAVTGGYPLVEGP